MVSDVSVEKGFEKYGLILVVIGSVLIRWTISLGSYSGNATSNVTLSKTIK